MNPETWGRGDSTRIATRDVPAAVVALVEEREGGRHCVWCKRQGFVTPEDEPIELDHLRPLSKGGDNHHSNLAYSCRAHNRAKRDRPQPNHRPTWARGVRGRAR